MKDNIILFDIDYTLFDVGKYRCLVFAKLHTFFPQIPNFIDIAEKSYEEIRKTGWFEIQKFTKQLLLYVNPTVEEEKLADVWRDPMLLKESIYPEAADVLKKLSENFTLGIFSSGVTQFQKSKIANLSHLFKGEHVHIHELKDERLSEILKSYDGKKVIVIDDYIPVIEKAKQIDKNITAIWIKRGKLAEKVPPSTEYPPDYTIEDLRELLLIVQKFRS